FMLAEASKAELTLRAFDADYNWPMKDAFNAVAATQGVNKYAAGHGQNLPKSNARTL
ncbi:MAG TPA: alpha-amylase, partial [Porphyromonadaceae bacterium]|nr:alpha-amylase [Porphyromonadaceae bacterium]